MRSWIRRLHLVEDALLVLMLSSMIVLASAQILLRNFFEAGIVWADPLLRVMVLWLGLIGASVATRNNKHVRIDLTSKLFERNTHRLIQAVVGQVSAWTCLVIAWFGFGWVRLDFADGVTAFADIPAWIPEAIVPVGFALIGARYFFLSLHWAQSWRLHRKADSRRGR